VAATGDGGPQACAWAARSMGPTTIFSPGPGSAWRGSCRRNRRSCCRPATERRVVASGCSPGSTPPHRPCSPAPGTRLISRPPVHGRRRAPGVHVGRDPDQHLRAAQCQLPDRFGEQPVVADRYADAADLRVGHRIQRLDRSRSGRAGWCAVPRASRGGPCGTSAGFLGPDQTGRVEHVPGPARSDSRNVPVWM
jgi:hypothetical protein